MATTLLLTKSQKTEHLLVGELQSKNFSAFDYLYRSYSHAIKNCIQKIIGCSVAAEDVFQNSFLKIWLNIDSYNESKGTLYTWMITIARNESIDYLRSKYVRDTKLTVPVFDVEIKEHVTIYSRLEYNCLLKSLSILPHKDRRILELHGMGFTCKDIANKFCIPEGSIKTRMRMSYKRLRIHLGELN